MSAGSEEFWRKVDEDRVLVEFWGVRGSSREVRKARSSASAASSRVRVGVGSVEGASWVGNGEVVSLATLTWDRNWPRSDESD